jgi:hypothetical protein
LGSAVGLIALALVALIAAGEIWVGREGVSTPGVSTPGLSTSAAGGAWVFVLHGVSTPWAIRLWSILGWDLLLGAILLWLTRESPPHPLKPIASTPGLPSCTVSVEEAGNRPQESVGSDSPPHFPEVTAGKTVSSTPRTISGLERGEYASRRWEALLGLGVTVTLWRLVFLSGLALATGPGAEGALSGRRDLLALWLTVGLVLAGKERLARSLEATDRREQSPLLGALAWHHRKDGVFSVLLALSLTWGFLGGSAGRAELVLNLVKILLLGGAAEKLTRRCVGEVCRREGGEQE